VVERLLGAIESGAAAHIDDTGLPLDRYLVRIDVPDAVWPSASKSTLRPCRPPGPRFPGRASVRIGSDWLASVRSPLLLVPAVIVPEEAVALLNRCTRRRDASRPRSRGRSNTTGCFAAAERSPIRRRRAAAA
jgi:hypothetical protein